MESAAKAAICAAILLVSAPATAGTSLMFCNEPSRPYCLDYGLDKYNFDTCRYEVEQFVKRTKEFIQCLDDASSSAADAAKKAVKKFNCLAERNSYC